MPSTAAQLSEFYSQHQRPNWPLQSQTVSRIMMLLESCVFIPHHSPVMRVFSSGSRNLSWKQYIEEMLEKIPVMTSWGIPASVSLVQNTCREDKHNICIQKPMQLFPKTLKSGSYSWSRHVNIDTELSMLFIHTNISIFSSFGFLGVTSR